MFLKHRISATFYQLFYQLFVVLFPGVCGASVGGMPTGLKVFLDFAGRVRAAALRPDPLLKSPSAVLVRWCA